MRPDDTAPEGAVCIPLRAADRKTVRAYALVDAADAPMVNQWRWSLHKRGYAVRHQMIDGVQRAILLHRQILGLEYGDRNDGDHKNRDRLDCRRENLRPTPRHGNRQNVPSRGGASAYRGVSWDKQRGRWTAYAHVAGKKHNFGYFEVETDAAAAALAARQRLMPYALD